MIGSIQILCLVIMTVAGLPHGYGYCQISEDAGSCNSYVPRYYHSSKTGRCVRFVYGGCGGNANKFATYQECENACTVWNVCDSPKDTGSCSDNVLMYYFNKASGLCEEFTYGGCHGNGNRFLKRDQCLNTCRGACAQPKNTGSGTNNTRMFFFNITSEQCQEFEYGGKGGNGNRFETREECQNTCAYDVCAEPRMTGRCTDNVQMYFFNKTTGKCEPSVFGQCAGMFNRFISPEDCRNTCGGSGSGDT